MNNDVSLKKEREYIRAAQRNPKKFEKLYELYYDKIHRYILSKTNRDFSIADDLTSITFEKALQNIGRFKWQGISFSAWIYRIANNTLIDYYRKENTKKNDTTIHENISDKKPSTEDIAVLADSQSRIFSAIQELNKREQEIITMKFYEGLTNKEIAYHLGISETNVGTIVHRTMLKLKEIFKSRPDINM